MVVVTKSFVYNGGMDTKETKIDFPLICKQIRNKQGYTQKQMAEMLDVHPRNYQRWEKGEGEPNAQAAFILARLLSKAELEVLKKNLITEIKKKVLEIELDPKI